VGRKSRENWKAARHPPRLVQERRSDAQNKRHRRKLLNDDSLLDFVRESEVVTVLDSSLAQIQERYRVAAHTSNRSATFSHARSFQVSLERLDDNGEITPEALEAFRLHGEFWGCLPRPSPVQVRSLERNPPCAECVERERLRAEWRAAQPVKKTGRKVPGPSKARQETVESNVTSGVRSRANLAAKVPSLAPPKQLGVGSAPHS
jgi:hypothetical protein